MTSSSTSGPAVQWFHIDNDVSIVIGLIMSPPAIFLDPRRPKPEFRPLKALHHFRLLIADKEDTAQVFHIIDALPRPGFTQEARAFCDSEQGRALMAREPWLPDLLDDHDALLAMPEGSVAHAYVAFMRREGLSAAGLVAEESRVRGDQSRYDDQFQWYSNRLRDTHDLVHVLTGYGRDALGEQCVLGFTYGQEPALGVLFIAWAGALELKRRVKVSVPVFRALAEGQRNGRRAEAVFRQDIRALLAEPLDAARARMHIPAPALYEACHRAWRARGVDPYALLAPAQPQAAAA